MFYTKTHEWIRLEDNQATIGITDHAQETLSDIVFVELPKVGAEITQGESFMTIESVKAASDIYAPMSGKIIAVNDALSDTPERINESPEQEGWLVKIKPTDESQKQTLLSKGMYTETLSQS